MFVDPVAAGKRSVEVRGVRGNSLWGRRLRQMAFSHPGRPKKPKLCDYCGEEIHSKTDTKAELIKQRLRAYEKRTPQPVVDEAM